RRTSRAVCASRQRGRGVPEAAHVGFAVPRRHRPVAALAIVADAAAAEAAAPPRLPRAAKRVHREGHEEAARSQVQAGNGHERHGDSDSTEGRGGQDVLRGGLLPADRAAELVAIGKTPHLFRHPNWRRVCDEIAAVKLMRCTQRFAIAALAAVAGAFTAASCSQTETSITAPSDGGSRCQVTATPTPPSFPPPGGQGSVTIATTRDCTWSIATNAAWVWIASERTGQGEATVACNDAANPVPSPR